MDSGCKVNQSSQVLFLLVCVDIMLGEQKKQKKTEELAFSKNYTVKTDFQFFSLVNVGFFIFSPHEAHLRLHLSPH
jgi:hypothetical protein